MIQIENLTPEQVEMLDIMWSLESYEEYCDYLDTLNSEDRQMAESLAEMVILAEMDNLIGQCVEAKDYLKKFALQ
jgi:hypothetical protein